MQQIKNFFLAACVGCALLDAGLAYGVDRVLLQAPAQHYKTPYGFALLNEALKATKNQYGPYTLAYSDTYIQRSRIYWEMQSGEKLNVAVAPPLQEWKDGVLRIPFPVFKGVASFRIGLVMKENTHLFKNTTNLKGLKHASYGTVKQWTTTKVLENLDFKLVYGRGKNELMHMMAANRFDVFSRGIHEVFDEYATWEKQYPQLMVEPHIAIFTYLPNYFHVSPTAPRLARRIEEGLLMIHKNGTLDKIFYRFHSKFLIDAGLQERKIFEITNPNLEPGMLEHDRPYLLDLKSLGNL